MSGKTMNRKYIETNIKIMLDRKISLDNGGRVESKDI